MKKIYLALFMFGLFLTSCGDGTKEENRAEELCACMEDSEVEFELKSLGDLRDLTIVINRVALEDRSDLAKCFTSVLEDIKYDLKGKNDDEKATYLKKFTESYNETDCGDMENPKEINVEKFDKDLKWMIRNMQNNIDIGDQSYDDY